MDLTLNPVEQTAAAASGFVALLAVGIACYLLRISRGPDRLRGFFWIAGICLAGLAGLIGGVVYGFSLPGAVALPILTIGLDLCRMAAAGMFLVGVAFDLHGPETARRALPFVIVVSFMLYLVAYRLAIPSSMTVLYEAAAMQVVFIFYSWMATRFCYQGARWMAFGAVFFIIAALLQTYQGDLPAFLWPFNSYAISCLVRMLGLLALALGLRSSLLPAHRVKLEEIAIVPKPGL